MTTQDQLNGASSMSPTMKGGSVSEALSAALVVITAIYAWLTWKIASESGKAAAASKDAARAAAVAAEAANRSATVAEAALSINFDITLRRHADGDVWFNITPSANVFLHRAVVDCVVIADPDDDESTNHVATLGIPAVSPTKSFPWFTHAGETISLEWKQPALRRSDHGALGFVKIDYSLSEGAPRRTRGVFFETVDGLGSQYLHSSI
jgi:hypothetical protein